VSGGTGAVASAKLRLYVRDGTDNGPKVYAANNTWDESAVTWETKPARSGGTIADTDTLTSLTWVEYDVTTLVASRGTYTFNLVGVSADQVAFTSRNSGSTTQRPQLVVAFDANAPSTSLDATPPSLSGSGTASFAFSANDPLANFECTLDGAAFAACASPKEYTGLADGSHTFQVRAVDAAGNADPTPVSFAWTVDTLAPQVEGVAPTDGATGVVTTANIVATFAEPMDPATLTEGTFSLVPQGSSNALSANVSYDAEAQKAELNPVADLAAATTYTATLKAGLRDASGNPLAEDKVWSFRTAGPAKTTTVAAEADAYVASGSPDTNYNRGSTLTDLKVDASPAIESLIRFTVSGFSDGVTSAKLRLYVGDDTDNGPKVYQAGNTWDESTVTWNTRPARMSAAAADAGDIATGAWVELDVSALVDADGTYTFNLVGDSANSATFRSREATTESRRPQLMVNYDPAAASVKVSADVKGGTYTARQTVTLTSTEPSTIYYTTDGSDPVTDPKHTRHTYIGPLDIPVDTTLKFYAVTGDGRASSVVTELYTINVTAGFRDFYYGGTGVTEATADKTESKLWFNDGIWWGSLYDNGAGEFRIHRFDGQGWVDTGTTIDTREDSRADVLWDGNKLYIASGTTVVSEWGNAPTAAQLEAGSAQLLRYSYNPNTKTYSLDSGFPVTVRTGSAESMTLAKDSTGQLWITFTRDSQVWVNRSLDSDTKWGESFVPAIAGVSVHYDDISAIVAFGGKIGLMWSNQNDKKFYFAVHSDSDADGVWQATEVAHGGGVAGCGTSSAVGYGCANDHLNLKATSDGRVFAGIKTANKQTGQAMVRLVVRGGAGGWTGYTFSNVEDEQSRPRVLIDEGNGWVYVLATKPELGAAIFYKRANLDNISFAPGVGESLIKSPSDPQINNPTSTKQNLSGGFMVLASDTSTKRYLYNELRP
jgi:hypothetical protein